jgi:hypothetical protein
LGNLFEELKRRKVFRVGAAYLVVGWIALQVVPSDTLSMPALPAANDKSIAVLPFVDMSAAGAGAEVDEIGGALDRAGHRAPRVGVDRDQVGGQQ